MHAEERKAHILQCALPLFAMKGFAATTTRDLAQASGISEGLLYKHFPSKENLYKELGRLLSEESTEVSKAVARREPSTESLVHGMYYLTRMVLAGPCGGEAEHAYVLRLMARSLMEDGLFARAFMEAAFLPYVKPLQDFFEAARKAGDLITEASSDLYGIFFAHHLMVGIKLHGLSPDLALGAPGSDASLLPHSVLYNLRGIGLTQSAIARHFDPAALDAWYAGLFPPDAGSPAQPFPATPRT
jgi:AcrR family transcriptional regulator